MGIPAIQNLPDRILIENMLFSCTTAPDYYDEISDTGTSPSGYEGISALTNGEVYPITVLDPATGDWFSCFARVNTSTGVFNIDDLTPSAPHWTQGTATAVPVTVIVALTSQYLKTLVPHPIAVPNGYEIKNKDNKKVLRFTSGSAQTVYINTGAYESILVNDFVCWLVVEGAGTITIDSSYISTINGAASNMVLTRWKLYMLYPAPDYNNIVVAG